MDAGASSTERNVPTAQLGFNLLLLSCLQSRETLVPPYSLHTQKKMQEEEEKKNTPREALTHLLLLDKSKFMTLSAFESLLSP